MRGWTTCGEVKQQLLLMCHVMTMMCKAFHMGRGLKQGQLAGSNYIEKYHGDTEVKVYVGNLSKDAGKSEEALISLPDMSQT